MVDSILPYFLTLKCSMNQASPNTQQGFDVEHHLNPYAANTKNVDVHFQAPLVKASSKGFFQIPFSSEVQYVYAFLPETERIVSIGSCRVRIILF